MLIGLASAGRLSDEMLAALAEPMRRNPDQSVKALAADLFQSGWNRSGLDVGSIMAIQGQAEKGKAVYASYCSSCHRVGSEGPSIGPDLTTIGGKYGKSGMVDAIVYPSAGISFGYETWLITRKDGTTVFGFLQGDGRQVTMRDMAGKMITIPSADIVSRKQFETSIMPQPAAMGLSEQDVADVVAYLVGLR